MKTIFLAVVLFSINSSYSQLATLPPSICESYKSIGWIIFNPSSISTGELFTTYYSHFFTDPNNTMVLDRSWHDNFINLDHKHYSQYYNGIRVEGRGFSEHFDGNGDIEYANGKICSEIGNVSTSNIIGSESALDSILANYEYNQWSWDSPEFEAQYKTDLEDSLATSYPMGELVFALKSWDIPIEYNQDANDYRLAWKFEIQSLLPSFHVSVYVDAVTGEVLKIYDNVHHDGIADIPFHGAQTIDTRWLGFPTNKHVLHTNNAGRNVHSKYDGALSWGLTSEVKDADGTWGTSEQGATAAHWSVTKAWDYFKNTHDRDGLDGSGGKVRVLCESTDKVGAWYAKFGGIDRIFAGYDGGVYHGEVSVLAHEFTHGIDEHSGKLIYKNESGALDESFADIFGFLVRRYATGSISWEVGVPTANTRVRRNLQFPKTIGFHYDVSDDTLTITEETGQPDTYKGEFWFEYGNDNGGVHINSGVQNHWFYMLCNGEIGTNDIGDSYVVYGIGIEKSAEISYYNLTSNMEEDSDYEDAMTGAILAAGIKWGECSFEYIETQNAWYAAGVGEWSYCYGAGISDNEMSFSLYPNPTIDIVNIDFFTNESKTINVYSTTGQLLKSYSNIIDDNYAIDISNLANGSYFVEVIGKKSHVSVFVKK